MVNLTPSPSGGEPQLAAITEVIRGREGEGEREREREGGGKKGMGERVSTSASEPYCGFHCYYHQDFDKI